MIAIIDNYDSFTYNLVQYIGELGYPSRVFRNDRITVEEIAELGPTHLIVSPGPGRPEDAGVSCEAISRLAGTLPILGVCLGHQCIAHVFNGTVTNAEKLIHGKTSSIYHTGAGVYQGLPSPFKAARYNSLVVQAESLPENIRITAHTADGEVMGIRLDGQAVEGVQFHPESVLTRHGKQLLSNFLNMR
jgi:anthranilate synthase/aminodeoxychorismate synthase-like glutamine amidotransferase